MSSRAQRAGLIKLAMSLSITHLGSGSRGNATLIECEDHRILIDQGFSGRQLEKRLGLMNIKPNEIEAILITHLHSDHIAGVGEAAEQSWINGRVEPLTVIGPDGVDNLANGFNLVYERDRVFRKAHHERGDIKFPLDAVELRSEIVKIPDPDGTALALKDGELTITAIRVAHDPISPAFGYRFDYKDRSVVISGDTKAWPPLGVAAKGADVLIHEAQSSAMMMAASRRASRMNPRGAALLAFTPKLPPLVKTRGG